MRYEIARQQSIEDKTIITRILAGETVYGAFLRGTGQLYQRHEIHLITLNDEHSESGKLALCAGLSTHNGRVQERFSTLICEWGPVCERANEVNRGGPMTDAEKAERTRRRLLGRITDDIERMARRVVNTEERIAEMKRRTPIEHLLRPRSEGGFDGEAVEALQIEKNVPGYAQDRYDRDLSWSGKELAEVSKWLRELRKKAEASSSSNFCRPPSWRSMEAASAASR